MTRALAPGSLDLSLRVALPEVACPAFFGAVGSALRAAAEKMGGVGGGGSKKLGGGGGGRSGRGGVLRGLRWSKARRPIAFQSHDARGDRVPTGFAEAEES